MNCFTWIIFIHDCICYTKIESNENSPDSLNVMVNLPLPRLEQVNYLIIPIYAGSVGRNPRLQNIFQVPWIPMSDYNN